MMSYQRKLLAHLLCPIVVLTVLSSCTSITAQRKEQSSAQVKKFRKGDKEGPQTITQGQLREEIQRFAYRFASHANEPVAIIAKSATSSNVRQQAHQLKFAYTWTVVDIAIGPNPEVNMIDMLMFVTLSRMIAEDYWVPQVFGEQGMGLAKALRGLEEDIWTIGARVLDQEQQEELRGLIRKWREQHPDKQSVTGIRFANIAPQSGDSSLADVQKPGGLLGQVQQATEAVDEIRLLSERLIFFMKALLPLTRFQAEATVSGILAEPAIEQTFSDIDRLTSSTERYAAVLERLPAERDATLTKISRLIALERKNFLDEIVPHEDRLQGVLTNLRETLVEANKLVVSVDSLAVRYVPAQDQSRNSTLAVAEQKPFDIKDYQQTVSGVTESVRETQKLVLALDQILNSPGWKERLPDLLSTIDRAGKQGEYLIEFSIYRVAVLMLVFFLVLFLLTFILVRYLLARVAVVPQDPRVR
jgi:hypothetical protein